MAFFSPLRRTSLPKDFREASNFQKIFIHKIPESVNIGSITSLKNWVQEAFLELKVTGLEHRNLIIVKNQSIDIDKYGSAFSYSVKLDGDFPTGIQKNFTLIISAKKREGSLFPLEILKPINVNKNGAKYIGGIMPIRGKDFYINYIFKNNEFILSMNTLGFCDYGIPIGIYTKECIEYKKNRLDIYFQDLNRDHIDDIIFSGVIEYYCKPHFDRDESQREPIKRQNISIEFVSSKSNLGIYWELKNKDICAQIPKN